MSDIIQEKYNAELTKVKPSDEFLSRLTETLENEQALMKRRKISVSKRIISAAACMAMLAFSAAALFRLSSAKPSTGIQPDSPDSERTVISSEPVEANAAALSGISKPVIINTVTTEGMSAPECAEAFLSKYDSGELSYIKESDRNIFTEARQLEPQECEKLAGLIRNSTAETAEGDRVYYMAVFSDGAIVKFTVTNGESVSFTIK